MTLDEWVTEQQERLVRFREFWESRQTGENAEHYPNELNPGDWDEQYRLWEG